MNEEYHADFRQTLVIMDDFIDQLDEMAYAANPTHVLAMIHLNSAMEEVLDSLGGEANRLAEVEELERMFSK